MPRHRPYVNRIVVWAFECGAGRTNVRVDSIQSHHALARRDFNHYACRQRRRCRWANSVTALIPKPIAPRVRTPANNSGLRNERAASRIIAPRPASADIISVTTARINDTVSASLRPAKISGKALGNMIDLMTVQ